MNKEIKVFVLNIDETEFTQVNIEKFYKFPYHEKTQDFINKAEQQGKVYSLEGFGNAFNAFEVNTETDLIYITDKY